MEPALTSLVKWAFASQFPWNKFPSYYADWLQYSGSLTQRFRELSHDNLKHELLFNDWQTVGAGEATPLNNSHSLKTWVREIIFYGNNQAWEWAKTIIPNSSLIEEGEAFIRLGNKPIGDILFTDPKLKRSEFEIAQLDTQHPYCKLINDHLNTRFDNLWARRSMLYFYQKPLLIYEVFLPKLFEYIEAVLGQV